MPWNQNEWAHLAHPDDGGQLHHMDAMHVNMIYEFLARNEFKDVVEVGCKYGYSTSAFIQALREGKGFRFTCIDICITDDLRQTCAGHDVRLLQMDSRDGLQICRNTDCLCIDGYHFWENVGCELAIAMRYGVKTIIAHDVSDCSEDGPKRMLEQLRRFGDWDIFVEDKMRPGLITHRGIMFATCDRKVKLDCGPWQ